MLVCRDYRKFWRQKYFISGCMDENKNAKLFLLMCTVVHLFCQINFVDDASDENLLSKF